MEYYVDVTTDVFEKIKAHEIAEIVFGEEELRNLTGREGSPFFAKGDTLKLYPPGVPSADPEALRVLVTGEEISLENREDAVPREMKERTGHPENQESAARITVSFELMEWIFAMETELDDLLREEKEFLAWYEGE